MDSTSPFSQIDHGVDIVGDEWEEPEEEEVENKLNKILPLPKKFLWKRK